MYRFDKFFSSNFSRDKPHHRFSSLSCLVLSGGLACTGSGCAVIGGEIHSKVLPTLDGLSSAGKFHVMHAPHTIAMHYDKF
jgi:hypothetical protein